MATNTHRLLLASQSPRRRELLTLLGIPFEVTAPDVVETPRANEAPSELVARLSQAKARAAGLENSPVAEVSVATSCALVERAMESAATFSPCRGDTVHGYCSEIDGQPPIHIVIACDTVVALGTELLGKPRDAAEATAMLRRLRERLKHAVYSAVTLLEPAADRVLTAVAKTELTMRAYTDAEIAAYVASGDPMDKAGAYAIQHPGFHPVASLQGCYANVVGFPLCHLTRGLRALGFEPSRDVPAACQAHIDYRCPVYTTILNDK